MNISLAPEAIFHLGTFPFTNTLLVSWVIVAFLSVSALVLNSKIATVPRGFQNLIEAFFEGMLGFADNITGDRNRTLKFFPLVATIFFFVLFSNFVELVPGLGSIGIFEEHEGRQILVPFIRSSSADLNFTLALAIISVVAAQMYGMRELGFTAHWSKYFVPPWKSPAIIGSFVGILELISEFAKIISFSFRLFGNIFAGEVLLLVVGFLAPYIAPLPFLFLEIFVGFVQAMVFSVLTLVFLKLATDTHGVEAHA